MAKGLVHPEFLELLANTKQMTSILVAPSMYVKQIFDKDQDYRYYLQQIFGNLKATHYEADQKDETYLKKFFTANSLSLEDFKSSEATV